MQDSFAARMGRWSAQHRKKAIFGWIAFVIVSLIAGSAIGVKAPEDEVTYVGDSGKAHKLVDGVHSKLIAGVNLPMLLRTVSYRHESLDALVSRAMVGATQGVIQVAVTAPQNQARRTTHDQDHRDHQQ